MYISDTRAKQSWSDRYVENLVKGVKNPFKDDVFGQLVSIDSVCSSTKPHISEYEISTEMPLLEGIDSQAQVKTIRKQALKEFKIRVEESCTMRDTYAFLLGFYYLGGQMQSIHKSKNPFCGPCIELFESVLNVRNVEAGKENCEDMIALDFCRSIDRAFKKISE